MCEFVRCPGGGKEEAMSTYNEEFGITEQCFNFHTSHLDLLFCGTQKCQPSHSYGPHVRPCFLMIYVHSGKGIFRTQNRIYHLGAGSTFFLFPGEITYYEADAQDPWEYSWIAFNCSLSIYDMEQLLLRSSVSARTPVHYTSRCEELDRLYREIMRWCAAPTPFSEIKIMSLFWDIVYQYTVTANQMEKNTPMASPISENLSIAVEYIKCYYDKNISVAMVAEHLGISREHLYTLFKQQFGISPNHFINDYRIQQAALLLVTTNYSVNRIAASVGFSDYNYFTHKFKNLIGMTPTGYRREGMGAKLLSTGQN